MNDLQRLVNAKTILLTRSPTIARAIATRWR